MSAIPRLDSEEAYQICLELIIQTDEDDNLLVSLDYRNIPWCDCDLNPQEMFLYQSFYNLNHHDLLVFVCEFMSGPLAEKLTFILEGLEESAFWNNPSNFQELWCYIIAEIIDQDLIQEYIDYFFEGQDNPYF